MIHDIDVLGCGAIYIDGERAFGSKPYGLFSTVTWKASDEDLKRIADRCLKVISDRKTENSSEIPNNCEPQTENLFTDKYGDVWEWRGDAWYCISGEDEPQTDCAWK